MLDSPALPLLRDLQSLLDILDIEGLATFLARTTGVDLADKFGTEEVEKLGGQPRLAEWVEWVGRYAPLLGRHEDGEAVPLSREARERAKAELESRFLSSASREAGTSSPPPWRDAILAYLLSATFKDCSLMIRLPLDSSTRVATVKAIDLDPKPLNRLGKYFRMDREIVECWKERLERLERQGGAGEVRKCSED